MPSFCIPAIANKCRQAEQQKS